MKHSIIKVSILCVTALVTGSCSDFLEGFLQEQSQNKSYVKTAKDVELTLRGSAYYGWPSVSTGGASGLTGYGRALSADPNFPFISVMDDDCEETIYDNRVTSGVDYPRLMLRCFYKWDQENDLFHRTDGIKYTDYTWAQHYRFISRINALIYQIPIVAKKDNDSNSLEISDGQAHFMRAMHYFTLANIYGLPYCKATAKTDLCVPVKLTEMIEDKQFSRSTCEDTYKQIVSDLVYAAGKLEGKEHPSSVMFYPQEAPYYEATQAMLSRVYLYMERYQDAIDAADNVIATGKYSVLDYRPVTQNVNMKLLYTTSPETIFTQGGYTMPGIFMTDKDSDYSAACPYSFCASPDLLRSFPPGDLRRSLVFFMGAPSRERYYPDKFRPRLNEARLATGEYATLRLPEVLLNKAEALAMLGRDAEARAVIVDNLIDKRFTIEYAQAQKTALGALSGNALKDYIRAERRRELCFEGQRWYDLRRYQVNSVYPLTNFSITHQLYRYFGTDQMREEGKVVLRSYAEEKGSWVIPIPASEIVINSGTLSNYPRPARSVIP